MPSWWTSTGSAACSSTSSAPSWTQGSALPGFHDEDSHEPHPKPGLSRLDYAREQGMAVEQETLVEPDATKRE
ncbi:hypothetical protein VM98_35575, partial [Streptomyces rubellomurinus subsp. indigoferus]